MADVIDGTPFTCPSKREARSEISTTGAHRTYEPANEEVSFHE